MPQHLTINDEYPLDALDPNCGADSLPNGCRLLPDGTVELPRFFILDEHEFTNDRTGDHVKLDRKRLEGIADRINSRRKRTGDLLPIVVGHTVDGLPEKDQPDIVGYALEAKVEPFYDTGKYAIAVTPVAKSPKHVELFRKFPRRSVELWLEPDDIDPLSLLGATTPRRDLGMHRFHRGDKSFHYELSEPLPVTDPNMMPPNPGDSAGSVPGLSPELVEMLVKKTTEAVMQSPVMMSLADALNSGAFSHSEPDGDEDSDLLEPADDDQYEDSEDEEEELPDGDEEEFEESRSEDGPDEVTEEDEEEMPVKNSASHPSATNGYTPGYSKSKMSKSNYTNSPQKYERDMKEKAKRDLEASRERKTVLKLQRENDVLAKRIEALEHENKVNEVTRKLSDLDAIGVEYDTEREISTLVKMSAKEQDDHIAYIRKIYESGSKHALPNRGQVPVNAGQQAQVKMSKGGAVEVDDPTKPTSFEQVSEIADQVQKLRFKKRKPNELEEALQAMLKAKGVEQVR